MGIVEIVVAVVVIGIVGVVAYVFTRKKPALPAGEDESPAPPVARVERRPEVPAAPARRPAVPVAAASPTSIDVDVADVQAESSSAPVPPVRAAVVATAPIDLSGGPRDARPLERGLAATRSGWVQKLVALFGGRNEVDATLLEEVREMLIMGDVGPRATEAIVSRLEHRLQGNGPVTESRVWETLREIAREMVDVSAPALGASAAGRGPIVILVVGVNGVGKTTTIGKLAARFKDQGRKVVLAAGDTFRAAAVSQLETWGKRAGVTVVTGKPGSKSSAVVFDAVQVAQREGADVVIADTAGRLHTKAPLMDELAKVSEAAAKANPGAPHEVLLVLDATTGQNGVAQVREFREKLKVTGLVLTKLDGTAKGGVTLGICHEFGVPVRFVGVGEKVDDLRVFDAAEFGKALFSRDEPEVAQTVATA